MKINQWHQRQGELCLARTLRRRRPTSLSQTQVGRENMNEEDEEYEKFHGGGLEVSNEKTIDLKLEEEVATQNRNI